MFRSSTAYALICFALALCAAPAAAQQTVQDPYQNDQTRALIREKLDLDDFSLQDFDLPLESWATMTPQIKLAGATHSLSLHPFSVRSWNFKLLVQDEQGQVHEQEAPSPHTFSGSVQDVPDSVVAASIIDGRLNAMILLDAEECWWIQPLSDVVPEAPARTHVVYSSRNVRNTGNYLCGNGIYPVPTGCNSCSRGGGSATMGITGQVICEIAFDSDYEFYTKNGYSVTNTLHDIEAIANTMRVIYERDVDITYEVTTIIVRPTPADPYTTNNAQDLLNQFSSYWNANYNPAIMRDTAHLMTGRNVAGSTICLASLGVICSTGQAYGLSQSKFVNNWNRRVALTSHEVGHNWNANHCDGDSDCHIMCSVESSCAGLGLPNFGTNSILRISIFKNGSACLDDEHDPVSPPFFDDFPTLTLDPEKWSHINGAVVKDTADNEPSAPNALHIDASGSGPYETDEIRSNQILLSAGSSPEFSYYVQHKGVGSGEELGVEYWTSNLNWQEVNRITSDGVDQTSFTFYSHILGGNALHDEFRIRFRTEVDERFDDWYIDDVFVGVSPANPPAITGISPVFGVEGGGELLMVSGAEFTTNPPTTVEIDGVACGNVTVLSASQIACIAPAGTNGWVDVEVTNANGSDSLNEGYRYVPTGLNPSGQPFNCTDIRTESLDVPKDITLIMTGLPNKSYGIFYSFGPGPINAGIDVIGLSFPLYMFTVGSLNFAGVGTIPFTLPSGYGPLDFYIHSAGQDSSDNIRWAWGGNNPNGSGGIWFHLNN